ncbi:hemolysin family protein [Streptomyces johnsoniae]|uniref:Hemolysin family protein n=1 Tax=Streptomyces johnsoniae TaxID=3075532 RepID=A0ABU2SAB2_9ACTN|nr:hemolysin family protein [Streptomyces sp. DSM 41886]MDT0445885.1 hemolysin family protein [Streptomyces sp. DSM 41886]
MSAALGLLAVLVLTAGTGYFVAQEFAFVAADRLALGREAAAGDRRAARAMKVQERLSFMLSGAQLGITVTGLIVGFLAEPALAALLDPAFRGLGVPGAAATGIALVLAFSLAIGIQMVLGELGPKNLALAVPERLAKSLAASTLLYLRVAGPLIRIFDASANRLLRRAGIEPVEELHHGATLEELGHLIGESHEQGQLPNETAELLDHALGFSERTLAEVMVPRVEVNSVRASAPAAEVIALIGAHGRSHYLVVGERIDDIVGVVGVRELMRVSPERITRRTAGALARRALLLPDTLPLPGAVEQMQAADEEFAVVLDEYGGVAGIVTLEDIAEELVGEIADESDAVEELAAPDGTGWLVNAGRRVDEVAEATGLPLPEDDASQTVAGLVIGHCGRFPAAGDRIVVELADGGRARLEVLSLDRRVPDRVRLERTAAPVAPVAGRAPRTRERERERERVRERAREPERKLVS